MDFSKPRTVVFIDGANLYATAKNLEFDIDYKKFLSFFSSKYHLIRAYYYTALLEDQDSGQIQEAGDSCGCT